MKSEPANSELERTVTSAPLAPHFLKGDLPYFATFRTEGGIELPPRARDQVLTRCLEEHGSRYALFAMVVMADHVHLILQTLHAERGWPFDLVSILTSLKEGSALALRKALGGNALVWQAETFTVELRSQEIFDNKCEFIRQNPVRSRVVKKPEDYAWLWLSARM
jgi:REP element-mobilizing transposase RayT